MRNGIIVYRLSLIKTYILAFHILRKFRDSAPLINSPKRSFQHFTVLPKSLRKVIKMNSPEQTIGLPTVASGKLRNFVECVHYVKYKRESASPKSKI